MERENLLRHIPQVEKILQDPRITAYLPLLGRGVVVALIRRETDFFRDRIRETGSFSEEELISSLADRLSEKRLERLQRVVNATGIMIHTNLGRAPLSSPLMKSLAGVLSGYCNLELYLPSLKRGRRGGFAEELLCHLTGAEDALIVNNNASSVFLLLNEFGRGKDVIISRGELVQIGGGFRIPDILRQTGANLLEVGTTNITTLEDFRGALSERAAMILSVHQSNFAQSGFCSSPTLRELASLKSPDLLFVRDLGSGNLMNDPRLPAPFETTVAAEMAQGPDLLCFSGDKLLGACQAGIVLGRKDLVARLKKNPLMRMLRVDKITYYLLQETLLHYMNGEPERVSLWNMALSDRKVLTRRIGRFLREVGDPPPGASLQRVDPGSAFGGGSLPTLEIESAGVQISISGLGAEEILTRLTRSPIPVVGYILNDQCTLDFRTVLEEDISAVAEAVRRLFGKNRETGEA